MTCTLSRSGLSFSRSNDREYGAWGQIRAGSGGDQGYVANLGHRRDAESGLTYMRARYYEPGTGRFVSQDPKKDGVNWFAYANNNPVNMVDVSGNDADYDRIGTALISWGLLWMGVGYVQFALGVRLFYTSFGVMNGSTPAPGGRIHGGRIGGTGGGVLMAGYSAIVMGSGLKTMFGGIAMLCAGQYLKALGEDGLGYAEELLAYARDVMPFYFDWAVPSL